MSKDHFPLNMKKHDLIKKIPTPEQVEKQEEPKMLMLIYRAIFYCLTVLLDIRWNTSHLKNTKDKKFKKVDNPVFKDSDVVKIQEGKTSKGSRGSRPFLKNKLK